MMNLALKCNGDKGICGIYCLIPGYSLNEGLRKINGDNDVVHLQGIQNRIKNVYVLCKYPNSTKPQFEELESLIFAERHEARVRKTKRKQRSAEELGRERWHWISLPILSAKLEADSYR